MKVTMERRLEDDTTVYTVEVLRADWLRARLDRIDWAVLLTPRKGVADVLQDLQLLAFRLEQRGGL